jgi:hypothetical protein
VSTTKNHSTVIDGITYTTTTLPASEGLKIMPKLVALLGDSLVGLIFATDEAERDKLLEDPKVLGLLITSIARTAAEDNGLLVLKDLLQATTCKAIQIGDAVAEGALATYFDDHFAGRYKHLVEVAMWVGRVNFFGP